jgi:uncharacterized protein with HXXEE motif
MNNISGTLSNSTILSWLWLFPTSYLIHIAEEYWGGEGYSAYLLKTRGVSLPPTRFLLLQSIGVVLMIVGVILAGRLRFPRMMAVILGAIVLLNGITHTATSAVHGGYGPGLLSSLLIWIPLGALTLLRLKDGMRGSRYWIGVIIGVAVNGIIAILTMRGGRIT